MILNLDHIAFLTSNLSAAAACLPSRFQLDAPERQPTECTLEQYAHFPEEHNPSFLFLEPIADGPYCIAMTNRGPGLHHFGLFTDSIDDAIDYFSSNGLLLHPITRYVYKQNAAWMCRPGIPFLVEIYAPPEVFKEKQGTVRLSIPTEADSNRSEIDWVPGVEIVTSRKPQLHVQVDDLTFNINLNAE